MNDGCDFYSDALADLALGHLEADRRARLEAHLAGCPECRHRLQVTKDVGRSRVPVPDGLEARLRAAVRDAAGEGVQAGMDIGPDGGGARGRGARGGGRGVSLRRWVPHLAAAAVLAALWIGVTSDGGERGPAPGPEVDVAVEAEYAPYGTWPASGEVVAGELVLSELSVEELESLLEEMES